MAWAKGDRCEARDKKGTWYEAKIEKEKGEGEQLKYFVKFRRSVGAQSCTSRRHFMCIVQRQGRDGGRFAFDTARAF